MANAIRLLEPRLANQIAAGEVVDRPASVVKELLENAIDAGASRIEIDIERGGTRLIRVTDNGSGIPQEELALALTRHATSKIHSTQDLAAIQTLGFRGEALASISAVSKLLLTSRPRNQSQAWQARAEGAEMQVQIQPAAAAEGTRLEVRDLFFNTPARQKFLRAERTEFNHIDDVVRKSALANPHIAYLLKHNGKVSRRLAAVDNAHYLQRIQAVCGKGFVDAAEHFMCDHELMRVQGWVTRPDFHRSESDLQFMFINGRPVKDKTIAHAVRQAYDNRLPPGRYPGFLLLIEMDPFKVDVNVHPTKHEVRFSEQRFIHDLLARCVAEALLIAQTCLPELSMSPGSETLDSALTSVESPEQMVTVDNEKLLTSSLALSANSEFSASGKNATADEQTCTGTDHTNINNKWALRKREVHYQPPHSAAQWQVADSMASEVVDVGRGGFSKEDICKGDISKGDISKGDISKGDLGDCIRLTDEYYLILSSAHVWLLSVKQFVEALSQGLIEAQTCLREKYLLFPKPLTVNTSPLEDADLHRAIESAGFRVRQQEGQTLLLAIPECFAELPIETIEQLFAALLSGALTSVQEALMPWLSVVSLQKIMRQQPDLFTPASEFLLDATRLDFSVFFREARARGEPSQKQDSGKKIQIK